MVTHPQKGSLAESELWAQAQVCIKEQIWKSLIHIIQINWIFVFHKPDLSFYCNLFGVHSYDLSDHFVT